MNGQTCNNISIYNRMITSGGNLFLDITISDDPKLINFNISFFVWPWSRSKTNYFWFGLYFNFAFIINFAKTKDDIVVQTPLKVSSVSLKVAKGTWISGPWDITTARHPIMV